MNTISYWADTTENTKAYSSLSGDIETDVAIVGAGITGLTAALKLSSEGKKVVVIDARRVGEGTTGFSTGNLYVPVQSYFQTIKSKFDSDVVKIVVASRLRAIDFIEGVIKDKNLDCQFERRPWYIYATEDEKAAMLDKEAEVLKETGIIQVDHVQAIPFAVRFKKALKIDQQARFNPLKYVKELASYLSAGGVTIYENTRATDIDEEKDRCVITTEHGKITANKVITATHIPKGVNMVQTLAAPYRSYVVGARLKSGIYPNANIWDTASPHHTISTHSSSSHSEPDILLVAGLHHKTGQGEYADHMHYFKQLEEFTRIYFDVESFSYHWSAQHYKSGDGLPYIGPASRTSDNLYMATGYYADGLTYGTVAGIILSDLISGYENPWASVFNSTRFTPFKSAGEFLKENANVFAQYLKVLPGVKDAQDITKIQPGEGRVIEHNGEKVAVYVDENRNYHAVNAVCPHLKCIVRFNNAEKTWDCPCHGSRFTIEGEVIEGPAYSNLEKRMIL